MVGKPPEVSNAMKMRKNIFSELEGDNWPENACGNISSQALGACLAESQFEGCAAQLALCFHATVLLGGHLFIIHWVSHGGGDRSSGLWGVGGTKNQQ
jgi:hypothetical protein